jgi:hypothetical protein
MLPMQVVISMETSYLYLHYSVKERLYYITQLQLIAGNIYGQKSIVQCSMSMSINYYRESYFSKGTIEIPLKNIASCISFNLINRNDFCTTTSN